MKAPAPQQHTQGPWSCDGVSEYTGELLIVAANGDRVARVCCYGPQSETPLAQGYNASVIACAPELLLALEMLLDWHTSNADDDHEYSAIRDARAIIAKAKTTA